MGLSITTMSGPHCIGLWPPAPQKTSAQTHIESTHVAAMIYYRKTLFGYGTKLKAVQFNFDQKKFLYLRTIKSL